MEVEKERHHFRTNEAHEVKVHTVLLNPLTFLVITDVAPKFYLPASW